MKPIYSDITKRLGEPLWWDENGVPRYEAFHPMLCNVYAKYVAFMVVECQECDRKFNVAVSHDYYKKPVFPTTDGAGSFHYGDPPCHGYFDNCLAGDTMGSVPIKILEFWERVNPFEWQRNPEYEVEFKEVIAC